MNNSEIRWHVLVKCLIDKSVVTQQQLADKLGVSQQAISHWMSQTRNPNSFAKQKLLDLAEETGIDIKKFYRYTTSEEWIESIRKDLDDKTKSHLYNKDDNLINLIEIYAKLSKKDKLELLKSAESLKAKQ